MRTIFFKIFKFFPQYASAQSSTDVITNLTNAVAVINNWANQPSNIFSICSSSIQTAGITFQSLLNTSINNYLDTITTSANNEFLTYNAQALQINLYLIRFPNVSQSCLSSVAETDPDIYRATYLNCVNSVRDNSLLRAINLLVTLNNYVSSCGPVDVSFI